MSSLALLAGCDRSPADAALRECGEGAVRLQVGEVVNVPIDVQCELRPQAGARYTLAFYDEQLARLAETQAEPYGGTPNRIQLTVVEGDGTSPPSAALAPALAFAEPPPSDHRILAATGPRGALAVDTEGPWSPGETLRLGAPICAQTACSARVARVLDGWLVFAVEESTLGADTERLVRMFDEIAPLFRQHALPVMHSAFTAERPVTGAAAGQLVVLFRGNVSGVAGLAYSSTRPEGTATHVIQMEMEPAMNAAILLEVLSHEVAHTFQAEFLARNPPAPGMAGARSQARWGTEGGATLVETETLRRVTGHTWSENLDFRVPAESDLEVRLFQQSMIVGGTLPTGYVAAAGFLEDLVARRVAAGESRDVALREVLRGSIEGWYGVSLKGPRRVGLTNRMQSRIPRWNPTDAVLAWTLTAGADDVLDDAQYQSRAWLRLSDGGPEYLGWPPFREITGGSDVTEVLSRPGGSSDWLLLRDTGAGVRIRVASIPSVRWKLLRIA